VRPENGIVLSIYSGKNSFSCQFLLEQLMYFNAVFRCDFSLSLFCVFRMLFGYFLLCVCVFFYVWLALETLCQQLKIKNRIIIIITFFNIIIIINKVIRLWQAFIYIYIWLNCDFSQLTTCVWVVYEFVIPREPWKSGKLSISTVATADYAKINIFYGMNISLCL